MSSTASIGWPGTRWRDGGSSDVGASEGDEGCVSGSPAGCSSGAAGSRLFLGLRERFSRGRRLDEEQLRRIVSLELTGQDVEYGAFLGRVQHLIAAGEDLFRLVQELQAAGC